MIQNFLDNNHNKCLKKLEINMPGPSPGFMNIYVSSWNHFPNTVFTVSFTTCFRKVGKIHGFFVPTNFDGH